MELRQEILEGTLHVFNEKGMKFTMDDIAKQIHISKKTIYLVFQNKEEMFLAMVDYLFDGIKVAEEAVLNDPKKTTVEKIKDILCVMPESYTDIDFQKLYILKDKYPNVYRKVEERLENGWENTILLIEQGIAEGVVRPISIPIMKLMMEASLEQFFRRDVLVEHGIKYKDALNEVVDILVEGIRA